MKVCSKCKVEKETREFYKDKNNKDGLSYKCKECAKKFSKKQRLDNPEYIKKWRLDNPGYMKEYNKKWNSNNPDKQNLHLKKYNSKINPAIYWIWEQHKTYSELIYIGESKIPNHRKSAHFTTLTNPEVNSSNVAYALNIGEIKRENLYFNTFHFEDNDNIRRQIEGEYITAFTPRYNRKDT